MVPDNGIPSIAQLGNYIIDFGNDPCKFKNLALAANAPLFEAEQDRKDLQFVCGRYISSGAFSPGRLY
jgi:hypothetical protein